MRPIVKMPQDSPARPRRRRLRYIAVLPTVITLGNLVCGFSAIHFALREMLLAGAGISPAVDATLQSQLMERLLPSFLSIGAMLIFVGMLFDMLDGLAARLTHKVSEFGTQIDSLSDVVTFGVAPAILTVAAMMREWHSESVIVTPLSEHAIGRAMWVSAAAYCVCASIRLARFNVEHEIDDPAHRSFRGLPSPGAAAVMASLLMLHEHSGSTVRSVLLCSLPVICLACALLMTSRIRYERVTQGYLVRKRPFEHLMILVAVFVVFWSYKAQTLAVVCCLYAASGPVGAVVNRFRRTKLPHAAPSAQQPPADSPRLSG